MAELVRRLRVEQRQPPPRLAVCLGSLLSRNQYLVDTEPWGYRDGRLPYRTHGFVDRDYAQDSRYLRAIDKTATKLRIAFVDATPMLRVLAPAGFLNDSYHLAVVGTHIWPRWRVRSPRHARVAALSGEARRRSSGTDSVGEPPERLLTERVVDAGPP
jgi:hypothetical protein